MKKLIVEFILVLFLLSIKAGLVQAGFCRTEETLVKYEIRTFNFFFFKFDIPFRKKYTSYTCCDQYSGTECNQLSESCRLDTKCRGQWCETGEHQLCQEEEPISQSFLGRKTRIVTTQCDNPRVVEHCCAGFTGQTCGDKDSSAGHLTSDEAYSLKQQLITDEGKESTIYRFDGKMKFGIGHMIKKEEPEFLMVEGTSVSEERIQEAFESDLHIAASDVARHFQDSQTWPTQVKQVVINIMFNTKIDGFKRMPEVIAFLKLKQWRNAAGKLRASEWYPTVKARGIRLADVLASVDETPDDTNDNNQEGTSDDVNDNNQEGTAGDTNDNNQEGTSDVTNDNTQEGTTEETNDGVACPNIIPRSDWGAEDAKSYSTLRTPVSEFFIHHTDGDECSDTERCSYLARNIQNYHMYHEDRMYADIGYSFLIAGDGTVYEGRGWTRVGAHTYNHNSKALAASFFGNYTLKLPESKALQAAKNLIACGVHLGYINSNYRLAGHRDAKGASTKCPGETLYNEIRAWTHYSQYSLE